MILEVYSQASYDKYTPEPKSSTLKASGGNYGGGSETLILQALDNETIHDENSVWLCGGVRVH